ncbi:DUF3105 domain-containing protein [Nocardioides sp. Iso805N]|uniref:DUF3105 domain-containing protein n=1 Tax=Nocardioides sp. Iso805N TaxID=1283287 RepID=UPI000381D65E|nr:DUF3105 domain-containing protein [Nocardioides sp. Iso805N]
MAKPSKSDRRAVVDSIRKQQRGADRSRGFAIVGVCVFVALLIVVLAAYQPVKDWWDTRKFNSISLASIGKPAAVCQKVTTLKADGNQQHVPTGQLVTYTTAPPAFGPHWNEQGVAPVAMSRKFYTRGDRPALEALVHNLEHGYTILWYDDTVSAAQINEIRAIGAKFPGDTNFRYKFIAVPWLPADAKSIGKSFPKGTHVAFTHWSAGGNGETDTTKQVGAFQYCSDVSGAALKTFMTTYPYTDSPEPGAM